MGRKRKVAAVTSETQNPGQLDSRDSRKRITTYEDIADSDEEFRLNRDEILLGEEPETKRRRKLAEQEEFLEQSDEEVLGYSAQDDSEDEREAEDGSLPQNTPPTAQRGRERDGDDSDVEEGEDYGWGTAREDLYGADAIETEEQAIEEEAEARRLQKKHLDAMRAADYGFDEQEWAHDEAQHAGQSNQEGHSVVTETLPHLHISPDTGPSERLTLLKARYPEFELLCRDFLEVRSAHTRLSKIERPTPLTVVKRRAASAYLGSLAVYFSLLTSTASDGSTDATALPASRLRDHPIMAGLLECRELWISVVQLPELELPTKAADERADSAYNRTKDEAASQGVVTVTPKKSRAQLHAEALEVAEKERKSKRLVDMEADLADLDALIAPRSKSAPGKSHKTSAIEKDGMDLGEEAPLSAREAADKATRKRSLRFYTSQIAQKANKRGNAGRVAGGDDDIPHRERLKDRQARLNAEAEKRGRRDDAAGMDLGHESDEEDHRQAQQIRADGDDEYYDLVAARTNKKKADKAALAEAQRQAALQGGHVVQEETVGADGKRKISYAIQKNKGLTPHRKKDVRNPRVKKRKKYDEKKKKLASIKPIYKGGEGRGGYGGELTGIKKGLVKSTKL